MHLGKLFGAVVLGELRDTWERGTRRSRVGGSYATDCMLVCGPTSCLYAIPTEGQKRESLRTGVTDSYPPGGCWESNPGFGQE